MDECLGTEVFIRRVVCATRRDDMWLVMERGRANRVQPFEIPFTFLADEKVWCS